MKKIAFFFPGQGSQHVGMLATLAPASPIIQQTFRQASEILGYDLWQLTQMGPESDLDMTVITQPAVLTASIAIYRLLQEFSAHQPSLLCGHSLGEYSALFVAGALQFEDALSLVRIRANLMQNAMPSGGAMAAILGLDAVSVDEVCKEAKQDQIVASANYNSPKQIVIAGHVNAVERAIELARVRGAKRAVKLAVSVPSHCDLMRDAAKELQTALENTPFARPEIPVLHNVDVASHEHPDDIRQALLQQLYRPVRWCEIVQSVLERQVATAIECGPSNVLTGLCKRIDRSLEVFPAATQEQVDTVLSSVLS